MTPTSLAPPPPEKPRRPPPAVGAPPRPLPRTRSTVDRAHDRVLAWSLALSLLLHLLLIVAPGRFLRVALGPDDTPAAGRADAFDGLEWVVPVPEGADGGGEAAGAGVPVGPGAPGAATRPPEEPTVVRVRPGDEPPPGGGPAGAATNRAGGSARDALRPGFRDPRLYVTPNPLPAPPPAQTDHQRYMEHLQARIDAINDSSYAAAERERRATDWTVTDGDGGRWGLSPDGIHLGDFTIPRALLPVPQTGDNATRQAGAEEERRREEILRQEERRERDATREERLRETRERADSARAGGGG